MKLAEIVEQLKEVSDTPLLDARLLMAHAKGNLEELVARRMKHEPISKIIGVRGFWKSEFITSTDVLDPRPDTETMIDAVRQIYPAQSQKLRILDIGIGSGCILYSLLDEYPNAEGVGVDKSEDALKIARLNQGKRNAVLFQKDFFQPDWTEGLGKFDIVVSNPPYIPTGDIQSLAPDVRDYDPMIALDGGQDGLNAYRALAQYIPDILATGGGLFLEVGKGQAKDVISLFEKGKIKHTKIYHDYGGVERIISFKKD